MIIRDFKKMSADERKRLTKKCCICGREFLEFGNNPYPYMEKGECCNRCNYDYVIPCRLHLISLPKDLLEKDMKKEVERFRQTYVRYRYDLSEELVHEIGEQMIKDLGEKGYFNTIFMQTNTILPNKIVPIKSMTKQQAVDCLQQYLAKVGKTLDEWITETGYQLYWNELNYTVCIADNVQESGLSINDPFIEPLIDKDADAIEMMAESSNVDVTESVAST